MSLTQAEADVLAALADSGGEALTTRQLIDTTLLAEGTVRSVLLVHLNGRLVRSSPGRRWQITRMGLAALALCQRAEVQVLEGGGVDR